MAGLDGRTAVSGDGLKDLLLQAPMLVSETKAGKLDRVARAF
jgi:hypothetical protein